MRGQSDTHSRQFIGKLTLDTAGREDKALVDVEVIRRLNADAFYTEGPNPVEMIEGPASIDVQVTARATFTVDVYDLLAGGDYDAEVILRHRTEEESDAEAS